MNARIVMGCAMLICAGPLSAQQTHDVVVTDDSFSPQHLTIMEGDSVRWTNQGSHPHNVVADDGSFRCAVDCDHLGSGGGTDAPDDYHGGGNNPGDPSPAAWSFVRTFNQPGQIGYYCETHGAPGIGMWGSITVEEAEQEPPVEPAFEINHGLAGSWYNRETSGQGFLFDFVVSQDPHLLVVYWFTHAREAGGPEALRWKFVEGHYQPGDSELDLDVYLVTGGVFDQSDSVTVELVGVATLTFESCTRAELSYQLEFDGDETDPVSGVIPLEALSPDIEPRCEELAE